MSDLSPAPARLGAASWLDKRLILGVLLVIGSVLVGARAMAGADQSQLVWSATHDLAAGSVLADDDLRLSRARLFGTSDRYLAGSKPVGYVVLRAVSGHELVPAASLSTPGNQVPRREVAVPVLSGHLPPDLARGEQVDLYVTPEDKALKPYLVLAALTVAAVTHDGGLGATGQDQPVVLSVSPGQVLAVVQALSAGRIDLVRVPAAGAGTQQ